MWTFAISEYRQSKQGSSWHEHVEANTGVPQCILSASEEVPEGKRSDDSFGLAHAFCCS